MSRLTFMFLRCVSMDNGSKFVFQGHEGYSGYYPGKPHHISRARSEKKFHILRNVLILLSYQELDENMDTTLMSVP